MLTIRRAVPSLVALALLPVGAIALQQFSVQGPREGQQERAPSSPPLLGTDAELRARGPQGLVALLEEYDRTKDSALLSRIDTVAGQRDAVWSRLYWYTDWKQAKAAAAAEHKPILYLRLLGKLTDEYSCANSRFFRTVLYANEAVSKVMREKFVLVWESERPVPVVTIDMGDGRTLKRTVTGNSIHYVLGLDGQVLDALPGLYDPETFLAALNETASSELLDFAMAQASHRADTRFLLDRAWKEELSALRGAAPADVSASWEVPSAAAASETSEAKRRLESPVITPARQAAPAPNAAEASQRAFGKTAVERPLVVTTTTPAQRAEPAIWERLGALNASSVHLDQNSTALMRSHNAAYADARVFERAMNQFRLAIAQDTARNQYDFRSQILGWLIQNPGIGVDALNTRVYSELFLTPRSDPWLGLKSDDVYSALPADGCAAN